MPAAEERKKECQLVVFMIGDEEFGVDIIQVREIVRLREITRMPRSPKFIEGVVNLRGQVVSVIDLAKRLEIPSLPKGDSSRIVVIEVEQNIVGMIVDSVSEVLRLPSENIEDVPPLIETEVPEHYILGVGKLKDRLLVLLDLDKVLTSEEIKHIERHVESINKNTEGKPNV
jgi:purine-binding chemotaxis protein CheW